MRHSIIMFLSLTILATVATADIPYLNKHRFQRETGYGQNGGYNGGGYNGPRRDYREPQPYVDVDSGYNPNYDNGDYNDGNDVGPIVDSGDRYEQMAYDVTGGNCVFKENPHSYACTRSAFNGEVFPLRPLDWWGVLQGRWFTVTYVNPKGNSGKAFYMAKNRVSPTQPDGVFNVNTDTRVGSMWIQEGDMIFENWQGSRLATTSIEQIDEFTFRLIMEEGRILHSFNCRDFNRNDNHHLLCAWDVKKPGEEWSHHGYFGFLLWDVWQDFLNTGKRR